jgi:hypothetical protein
VGEMALWGEKQHLLIYTNTETGLLRTFEQVNGGKIGRKIDEFRMEHFEEAKATVQAHFYQ